MTPQDKSLLVQQTVDILKEIQNPVILSDYVRNTAFKIDVDETILKKAVINSQTTEDIYNNSNVVPFIKRNKSKISSLERYKITESRLVELAFAINSNEKRNSYLEFLENYKPVGELNAVAIKEIKEILQNDTENLDVAKKLFLKFYNDNEIRKQLTDMVFTSGEYEKFTSEDFACSLVEIFSRLKELEKKIEIEKLKNKYNDKNTTEEEKIRVSREIIEQVKNIKNGEHL